MAPPLDPLVIAAFFFLKGTHSSLDKFCTDRGWNCPLHCVFFRLNPSLAGGQKASFVPYSACPSRACTRGPGRKALETELMAARRAGYVVTTVTELDHDIARRTLLPSFLPCQLKQEGVIAVDDSPILGA
ncbi:hypothetical protein ACHAXA_011413 [Cyclostephanos tholiformis]|uniref:Uncharacterized protein n=1 Tax=Cyclostephanos tholiformis TaxID=382380 RepID=A0ABD3RV51_9STRA